MYLKSLNLKGFKSFADPTTLDLETGITVVVGPNGSGKSNVVDAVAWVLGAQGPSVVRSAKMDDVIFAGTSSRPALGRAEVALVVDNSSRRLPIDFNEITITRTLFRSGESEYALNGAPCRLLDVQELLSDTGVGRQQHVIVGQGNLDTVLHARPEDRRAVIEEAAGILKFRRRRERAERRLESSEASLVRLRDLQREVRRQIRPLERQAASAFRHDELTSELASIELYLASKEVTRLSREVLGTEQQDRLLSQQILATSTRLTQLETELERAQRGRDDPVLEEFRPILMRLGELKERGRGVLNVLREREQARRDAIAGLEATNNLEDLEQAARRVADEITTSAIEVESLSPRWDRLNSDEDELARDRASHEERFADFDESRLHDAPGAARADVASQHRVLEEIRSREIRVGERHNTLSQRRTELELARSSTVEEMSELTEELEGIQSRLTEREHDERSARARLVESERLLREAEELSHNTMGQVKAFEVALGDARARAGVDRLASLSGVLGTLVDLVEIEQGLGRAFEAAVESGLDAVVVFGEHDARAALQHLRSSGIDGAVLAAREGRSLANRYADRRLPIGCEELRGLVGSSSPVVQSLLDSLLSQVVLCRSGFDDGLRAALEAPDLTVVTPEGERFSPKGWRVGSSRTGATRAALEEMRERADALGSSLRSASADYDRALQRYELSQESLGEVSARHSEARRSLDAVQARFDEIERTLAEVLQSIGSVESERDQVLVALNEAAAVLAKKEETLALLEADEQMTFALYSEESEARTGLENRARALFIARRELEVASASLNERLGLLERRRAELSSQIDEEHLRSRDAVRTRGALEAGLSSLSRIANVVERSLDDIEEPSSVLSRDLEERLLAEQRQRARLVEIGEARDSARRELDELRDSHEQLSVRRAEESVRYDQAVESLSQKFGVDIEDVVLSEPPEAPGGVELAVHAQHLREELARLGPVNPLAREELAELTERNAFLESQLDDIVGARRELTEVISAIDAEIVHIFADAFSDVAFHFDVLVSTLFPGGSGRLSLTEPGDLLNTGIEIEARPAGRNVRRLALLSGGERSLIALAFLFAIFRSRPSPFYILDEVEAALDEINLRRFLSLLEEFRDEAQLIVVSHQKATMEVADALYGVTMAPGGASKVVSEKMRDHRDRDLDTARSSVTIPSALTEDS